MGTAKKLFSVEKLGFFTKSFFSLSLSICSSHKRLKDFFYDCHTSNRKIAEHTTIPRKKLGNFAFSIVSTTILNWFSEANLSIFSIFTVVNPKEM